MLRWYRDQVHQFGPVTATILLTRVVGGRIMDDLSNRFLRPKRECPCCGWSGRRYYSYVEVAYTATNVTCPQCDSLPRHRRFFLWLTNQYQLKTKKGLAIVFAPERALDAVWQSTPGLRIFRADFEATRHVDVLLDLQHIPVSCNAVDLLWCHHVLEHIEDDAAAMKELSRILRPDTGELVVSVPMNGVQETSEFGLPDPKNSGHWRIYGDDFADKLAASGFEVQKVDYQLSDSEAVRFGILEDEPFYLCRKRSASVAQ